MIVVVEEVLCPARPFVIRRNLIAELGPSLKLLWSMSSDGRTYTAMLKSSKPNVWISGGTADETSTSMVGNKVFLYAPTAAEVLGFYATKTHDANGFAKDASRTILSVQGTSEGSSLTVRGLSVFGQSVRKFYLVHWSWQLVDPTCQGQLRFCAGVLVTSHVRGLGVEAQESVTSLGVFVAWWRLRLHTSSFPSPSNAFWQNR